VEGLLPLGLFGIVLFPIVVGREMLRFGRVRLFRAPKWKRVTAKVFVMVAAVFAGLFGIAAAAYVADPSNEWIIADSGVALFVAALLIVIVRNALNRIPSLAFTSHKVIASVYAVIVAASLLACLQIKVEPVPRVHTVKAFNGVTAFVSVPSRLGENKKGLLYLFLVPTTRSLEMPVERFERLAEVRPGLSSIDPNRLADDSYASYRAVQTRVPTTGWNVAIACSDAAYVNLNGDIIRRDEIATMFSPYGVIRPVRVMEISGKSAGTANLDFTFSPLDAPGVEPVLLHTSIVITTPHMLMKPEDIKSWAGLLAALISLLSGSLVSKFFAHRSRGGIVTS
jgi:hypothetical protein